MAATGAEVALLAAAALHLGFQLTVTAVVYPALARVPPADWSRAHQAHSRGITPVVAVVYAALVAAGGWALAAGPELWTWVSLAGAVVAFLSTALVAAPAHGRLGDRHDPPLVRRLLVVDRIRTLGAVLCLLGAVAALR